MFEQFFLQKVNTGLRRFMETYITPQSATENASGIYGGAGEDPFQVQALAVMSSPGSNPTVV